MNRRLVTILLCAFFVAAGASFVVYRLVGKQINSKKKSTMVVFAMRDLEIGTLVKATDLKTGEILGEASKDVLLKPESAIGRGVVSALYAGEPVSERRLALMGSGAGLAATIPQGMRACAVKVNEVVGLAGFAVPGMRVDVLISGKTPSAADAGGMMVKTLLQNIEVLSAGKNFQRDNEGKPVEVQVVNLLVTPEQAELLSLAGGNETRIQLVLRNPMDHELAKPPGTDIASLYGVVKAKAPATVVRRAAATTPRVEKPTAAAPPPPPVFVVSVINGSKHTEQKFQLPGGQQ
jgi:pilus assembly protein CpaB